MGLAAIAMGSSGAIALGAVLGGILVVGSIGFAVASVMAGRGTVNIPPPIMAVLEATDSLVSKLGNSLGEVIAEIGEILDNVLHHGERSV